jgi:Skp family chaperone for outer membrane proteins
MLVAGMFAALGAVFVSGASVSTGGAKPLDEKQVTEKKGDEKAADEKKVDIAKPTGTTRPTSAVFNMAAVMRDFHQAKYQVWLLNKKKTDLSKELVDLRGEYIKLQTELREKPDHPKKEQKQQQMLALSRQIEDEDRKISKQLNDEASAIISDLYDKMKAVVDKTAELNGYHIVFAYPDAVTPEELKSAYIKELKLKPPAAQPFYVAAHADITAVVVKTLNVWYPPVDQNRQPVDVSKLDISHTQPAPTTGGPAPGQNPIPAPGGGVRPPGSP